MLARALRYRRRKERLRATPVTQDIRGLLPVAGVSRWEPGLELWELRVDLQTPCGFGRRVSVRFGSLLVVGSCLQGHVVNLSALDRLSLCKLKVILHLAFDAQGVLFESKQRKVELLLSTEALQQLQIALGQFVHDLLSLL